MQDDFKAVILGGDWSTLSDEVQDNLLTALTDLGAGCWNHATKMVREAERVWEEDNAPHPQDFAYWIKAIPGARVESNNFYRSDVRTGWQKWVTALHKWVTATELEPHVRVSINYNLVPYWMSNELKGVN